MVHIVRIHLPLEAPMEGREIIPQVVIRRADNTTTAEDVPEAAPLDGHFLKYAWYCKAMCNIHPSEKAALECIQCTKGNIHPSKGYFCSSPCFKEAWLQHRPVHEEAGIRPYPVALIHKDNAVWYEVGHSKTYIPATDDIGNVLRFQCVVVNAQTKKPLGKDVWYEMSALTSPVIPAPPPPPAAAAGGF